MATKKPTKKSIKTLLEQVKARIRKHPRRYDQGSYCGTVCCIAGHIDCIVRGEKAHQQSKNDASVILDTAGAALDIDVRMNTRNFWLFKATFAGGPYNLHNDSFLAHSNKEKAEIGCVAIDLWMKERKIK